MNGEASTCKRQTGEEEAMMPHKKFREGGGAGRGTYEKELGSKHSPKYDYLAQEKKRGC